METKQILTGKAIVIADRGFVWVGDIVVDESFCVISNASTIRRWGTTKGLGELALEGPTKDTVLDYTGTVRVPMRAVIGLIDTEAVKWPLK